MYKLFSMEEAIKSLVGFGGLAASWSIAGTYDIVALLLAVASLVYVVLNIAEKVKKWQDGQ